MASAQEHGEVIIYKYNPATGDRWVLKRGRSETLGYVAPSSRTNPREQDERVAFMESGKAVDEQENLEVWFKPDAADTIESEESKFHLDITIVDKRTGRRVGSALSFENLTGFTSGGTVDLALLAADERRVAYITVPAGSQYALGREDGQGKCYVYFGDDTA